MDSLYFFLFLFFHLISLTLSFGSVLVIDVFGFLWLSKRMGVDIVLVRRVANVTQRLIWIGFVGLICSGIPMLVFKQTVDTLTLVKLFFVVLIGVNGLFLHTIKKQMDMVSTDADITPRLFARIAFASFVSQLGWWGAIAIGFLHRHWQHVIDWPPNVGVFFFGVLLLLAGVWAVLAVTSPSILRIIMPRR